MSSPGDLIDLERRIDELRVHTHGSGLVAIDRWLDNSRTAIRNRAVAKPASVEHEHNGVRRCRDYTATC